MTSKDLPKFLIRKAKPEDTDRIVEITAEVFGGLTAYHLLEENYGVKFGGKSWQEWKGGELRAFCASSLDRVYVAEVDGVVAGYMTYSLDHARKIGHVANNAVAQAYQRRGIATNLLRAVLETLKGEGMEYATVTTMERDVPARGLYEKGGLQALYRSITYYRKL